MPLNLTSEHSLVGDVLNPGVAVRNSLYEACQLIQAQLVARPDVHDFTASVVTAPPSAQAPPQHPHICVTPSMRAVSVYGKGLRDSAWSRKVGTTATRDRGPTTLNSRTMVPSQVVAIHVSLSKPFVGNFRDSVVPAIEATRGRE